MSKRHFFPILGPPKRIFKFHPLFVHPRPRKTWKPQHPEGFSKRSAAPARPRVAKARISYHQATASPDLSAYAQQPARGPTMGPVAADVGVVVLAGSKTGCCCCCCVVVVVVGTFGFGVRHSPWRTTCSVGVGQWWVVLWGWWVGVGRAWFVREGLGLVGWGAMLPRLEVMWARLGAILALRGAMLVHLSSYVAPAAFGFGVGGLELVGRGLCCRVWGWWVEVGQWWVVLLGLGLVGWGWSVVGCAFGFGVGGLGLGSGALRVWVWSWWVGVGRS